MELLYDFRVKTSIKKYLMNNILEITSLEFGKVLITQKINYILKK